MSCKRLPATVKKSLSASGILLYTGGRNSEALKRELQGPSNENRTATTVEVEKVYSGGSPHSRGIEMILDATAPHTRVDNFIIDDYLDKIDLRGLGIYMVIKRHYNWLTGQCTPSYNRIAELCNLSRRTVIRYVKRLKEAGLIDPQMRFTDEGQTSNQYEFYQPERPKKPAPAPAQPSTPAQTNTPTQMDTTEHMSRPSSDTSVTPLVTAVSPDQVVLNKKEEKENTKTMPERPEKTEKPASKGKTEKQKQCPHPYAEVVTLFDGTTICNHCYDLLNFLPEKEAA
jgi:hypothetical protein